MATESNLSDAEVEIVDLGDEKMLRWNGAVPLTLQQINKLARDFFGDQEVEITSYESGAALDVIQMKVSRKG